jgi:hypothetical protein
MEYIFSLELDPPYNIAASSSLSSKDLVQIFTCPASRSLLTALSLEKNEVASSSRFCKDLNLRTGNWMLTSSSYLLWFKINCLFNSSKKVALIYLVLISTLRRLLSQAKVQSSSKVSVSNKSTTKGPQGSAFISNPVSNVLKYSKLYPFLLCTHRSEIPIALLSQEASPSPDAIFILTF